MYDHLGGGSSDAVYGTDGAQAFADRARECVKAGFTAVKVLAVPMGNGLPSHSQLAGAEAAMGSVRDAVGDDVEVMVDFHGRTSPAAAIQYARVLAPYRPWFIEEPCQPENVDAMLEVTRAVGVPVATGERLFSRYEVRELLQKRVCAVLQTDVCHAGGITELRKIAAMAAAYDVEMAPHNPLGPIATAVNIHLGMSVSNFLVQEVMRADVPWRDDVVSGGLEVVDGHALPPTRPGIGIEVDEVAAARHPYVPEPRLASRDALGAVVNW
jgi:galactonate dehydratase